MNEVEKSACIRITNKMLMLHLFKQLKTKLNPTTKTNLTQSEIDTISEESVDLNEVLYNLQHEKYTSVKEWKVEISQIWEPPLKTQEPGSLYYSIAQEQKEWFQKQTLKIPHNEFEDWYMKIQKISHEVKNLLHSPPTAVIDPVILPVSKT